MPLRRLLLPLACLIGVSQVHAGLVLHYKFDETSGTTAADSSGSGYTGTLTNMTGSEWTTGRIGGALSFDGSNDRISVPVAALDGATAFSAAFWVNLDETGTHFVISAAESGSGLYDNDNELLVGFRASKFRLLFHDVTSDTPGNADGFSTTGWVSDWHHVAITKSSGVAAFDIYVDGSFDETFTFSSGGALSVASNGLWLGGDQDSVGGDFAPGQQLDGLLDDFRIYDHALSASEVSDLAAAAGAPEPAETFAFLGLLTAFGLGFREWRSRRKAKAA